MNFKSICRYETGKVAASMRIICLIILCLILFQKISL